MNAPDPNVAALLAQADEDYSRATESGDWYPEEDGLYACLVEKVSSGSSTKDGRSTVWFKPVYKILSGEYENRTMAQFYGVPIGDKSEAAQFKMGRMKQYVKIVNKGALTGKVSDDYSLACNSAGTLIEVEKKSRTHKGTVYVDLNPKRLLPTG